MKKRTSAKRGTSVRMVEVESAEVITFGPASKFWEDFPGPVSVHAHAGSIVRLIPPHDATDSLIAERRRMLVEMGLRPKVRPRASAPAVVSEAAREEVPKFEQPRVVIDRLIDQSNSEDRGPLRVMIEELLAQAEQRRTPRQHSSIDPGHITGIRIENWMCFQGKFELALGPLVYSITAVDENDPERSNWLGKSSLLNAIRFALTGNFPTRTADEFIHGDEEKAAVDLEFAGGLFVSRWRRRGKATKLEVLPPGQESPLVDAAAQRYLEEAVVDETTLLRTACIEQKATDRFIRMGPTQCSSVVNEWLGIEWIANAEEKVRALLSEVCGSEAKQRSQIEFFKSRVEVTEEPFDVRIARVERELGDVEMVRDEARKARRDLRALGDRKRRAERYVALGVERDNLLGVEGADEDGLEVATANLEAARRAADRSKRDVDSAKLLATRSFDGKCPVARIECPAAERINDMASEGARRLKVAERAWDEKQASLKAARAQFDAMNEKVARKNRAIGRCQQIDDERSKLAEDAEWMQANQDVVASLVARSDEELFRQEQDAVLIHHRLSESLVTLKVAEKTNRESLGVIADLEGRCRADAVDIRLRRAALAILGRNGVQRIVAEQALAEIERTGNDALTAADIDLGFTVQWSRETQALATACDECGAAFPASAKVKACERCGAERGLKRSNELRIVPSRRSGGADDIVGAVFQLSAAKWLRRYGGASWSVFLIDEPFGALDRANVRRLSSHLGRLLGQEFGAAQAFVVAHHADVLESAPGRIHITSRDGASRVEVLGAPASEG